MFYEERNVYSTEQDRWFDHPDPLSSRVQTSRITRLGYEIRFMSKKQRVYRILRAAQIRRALHVQKYKAG